MAFAHDSNRHACHFSYDSWPCHFPPWLMYVRTYHHWHTQPHSQYEIKRIRSHSKNLKSSESFEIFLMISISRFGSMTAFLLFFFLFPIEIDPVSKSKLRHYRFLRLAIDCRRSDFRHMRTNINSYWFVFLSLRYLSRKIWSCESHTHTLTSLS